VALPEKYRAFDALLHRVDRFPIIPRLKALVALTWWLAWAETTIAQETQIETDLRMLVGIPDELTTDH
jgi:hypothetical protein